MGWTIDDEGDPMTQTGGPGVTTSRHEREDGVLVRLSGRLDRRTVADVRATLHEVLERADPTVLLDLEEVVLGDASAVGLLVEVRRRAQRSGIALRVVAADERSVRILQRARLHRLLAPALRARRVPEPQVLAGA